MHPMSYDLTKYSNLRVRCVRWQRNIVFGRAFGNTKLNWYSGYPYAYAAYMYQLKGVACTLPIKTSLPEI